MMRIPNVSHQGTGFVPVETASELKPQSRLPKAATTSRAKPSKHHIILCAEISPKISPRNKKVARNRRTMGIAKSKGSARAGKTTEQRDLTAGLLGIGLLSAMAASAGSLLWFRVLP